MLQSPSSFFFFFLSLLLLHALCPARSLGAYALLTATLSARTRNSGDPPLEENGLGNAEFNSRHNDWNGYDYAYKMITVCELRRPITLKEMKEKHGFTLAPRGLIYLPKSINDSVDLKQQKLVRNLIFSC